MEEGIKRGILQKKWRKREGLLWCVVGEEKCLCQ